MTFPRARDQKSGVSGTRKKKGDNLIVAAAIINKCVTARRSTLGWVIN